MASKLSAPQRLLARLYPVSPVLTDLFTKLFIDRFRWRCLFICAVLISALLSTVRLASATATPYGMVDPVDPLQATAYNTYIQRCATCHVALPPAVLPTQTWQTLVSDPAHYGVSLPTISPFEQQLMMNYLQIHSRRHQGRGGIPYRLTDSAYFHALHPDVDLPQPLNLRSCAGCHLGASEQNYTQNYTNPRNGL